MLILRDMKQDDIEDYVRWFTTETEWGNWDAPWEGHFEGDADEQRRDWTEYYATVQDLAPDRERWKFEIEQDGVHIGWVSSYRDLDYMENPENLPVVGIEVIAPGDRGKGAGTEALRQFLDYYRSLGYKSVFTQTWSGNGPMLRVAKKLGFREVCRKTGLREVNGQRYDAVTFRLDL